MSRNIVGKSNYFEVCALLLGQGQAYRYVFNEILIFLNTFKSASGTVLLHE